MAVAAAAEVVGGAEVAEVAAVAEAAAATATAVVTGSVATTAATAVAADPGERAVIAKSHEKRRLSAERSAKMCVMARDFESSFVRAFRSLSDSGRWWDLRAWRR